VPGLAATIADFSFTPATRPRPSAAVTWNNTVPGRIP
jgi:hypothetical protein